MHNNHNKLPYQIHNDDINYHAMDEWAQCKNHGNHVNQRKLHMVHTLIFGKSTTDAHGHTRVKKTLICELFLEIVRSYLDKFLFFLCSQS